jgi:hypothetical protein
MTRVIPLTTLAIAIVMTTTAGRDGAHHRRVALIGLAQSTMYYVRQVS